MRVGMSLVAIYAKAKSQLFLLTFICEACGPLFGHMITVLHNIFLDPNGPKSSSSGTTNFGLERIINNTNKTGRS